MIAAIWFKSQVFGVSLVVAFVGIILFLLCVFFVVFFPPFFRFRVSQVFFLVETCANFLILFPFYQNLMFWVFFFCGWITVCLYHTHKHMNSPVTAHSHKTASQSIHPETIWTTVRLAIRAQTNITPSFECVPKKRRKSRKKETSQDARSSMENCIGKFGWIISENTIKRY